MPLFKIGFVIFPDLTLDFTGRGNPHHQRGQVGQSRGIRRDEQSRRARLSGSRGACNVRGRRLASV
jgi:hypothetical protein